MERVASIADRDSIRFVHTVLFTPQIEQTIQLHLDGTVFRGFWLLSNRKIETSKFTTLKNKEVVNVEVKFFSEIEISAANEERLKGVHRKLIAHILDKHIQIDDANSRVRLVFTPILSKSDELSWSETVTNLHLLDRLFEECVVTDVIDRVLASHEFSIEDFRAALASAASPSHAKAVECASAMRRALLGRLIGSNIHGGPLIEMDFMRTATSFMATKKNKQQERKSFVTHYEQTGRKLSRVFDPLLILTSRPFKPPITLERQLTEPEAVLQQLTDRLILMPELCVLYGLTWDMAAYGVSLRFVALFVRRHFVTLAAAAVIGHQWKNMRLLRQALTHPSACEHENTILSSYQRIEHLGDAVLNFFISQRTYRMYPHREGVLTMIRMLTANEALRPIMQYTGLCKFIHVSDDHVGDKHFADVYEAICAALYLDGGWPAVEKFVDDTLFRFTSLNLDDYLTGEEQLKAATPSDSLPMGWQLTEAQKAVQEAMSEVWNDHQAYFSQPPTLSPTKDELELVIGPLEAVLGIDFMNKGLLLQAVTHMSFYPRETRFKALHYQRLEFLGDSVLTFVTSLHVYNEYPSAEEALLSMMRQAMVRNSALVPLSEDLGLIRYMRKAEEWVAKSGGKVHADIIEAVIGAIYLDRGLESASNWIYRVVINRCTVSPQDLKMDPKSALQHFTQHSGLPPPVYEVVSKVRTKNDISFEVAVKIGGVLYGQSKGGTLVDADQGASQIALQKLIREERCNAFGAESFSWPFTKKDYGTNT